MNQSIDFKRGEFVATAHALLRLYMQLKHNSSNSALNDAFNRCEVELERLIGNEFQMRNDIGDPVQLSLLILLMNGEQHMASERRS